MRTVKEWIGKTDDADPTDDCKLRVAKRADYSCQICTRECKWGRGDTDHAVPIWKGGQNRESNLQWVCRTPCHSRKTAQEATERAKERKTQKRVAGIKKQSAWSKRYHATKEWLRQRREAANKE